MKSQPTTTMNRKNEKTTAKRTVGARPANFIIEDARTQSFRFFKFDKNYDQKPFYIYNRNKNQKHKKLYRPATATETLLVKN